MAVERDPGDGAQCHNKCWQRDWPCAEPTFSNPWQCHYIHYCYFLLSEHRRARCRYLTWWRQWRRSIDDREVLHKPSVLRFLHLARDRLIAVGWFCARLMAPTRYAPSSDWRTLGTPPLGWPKKFKGWEMVYEYTTQQIISRIRS